MLDYNYSQLTVKELLHEVRQIGYNGITWNATSVIYAKKVQLIHYLETGERPEQNVQQKQDDNSADASQLDFDMANRFIEVLSGNHDEAMTFQTFDDTATKDNRLAKWQHMERSTTTFDKLNKRQSKGAGVYIMVNRGDGKGRKAKNVVEVRALFVDLDGSPWEPAADMLLPHIRVESSPGRYHLYWLVSDCQLDQFKPIQQAIAKKFNGDKSCVDLARVLRLPGFLHLKKEPVLCKLIKTNFLPKYSTQHIIDRLQLDMNTHDNESSYKHSESSGEDVQQLEEEAGSNLHEFVDPATGEVYDLVVWAKNNPYFDIVAAVDRHYLRGELKDGKQHIICPFEEHHTEQGQNLSTFIANASPPQYTAWNIHCCHAHCADRDRLDFLGALLEKGWLSEIKLPAVAVVSELLRSEMKRPTYMNYRGQEIAAELVKQPLQPEEFRYNLHLMHVACTAYDGTLPDDSWTISRILGIAEDHWLKVKLTLIRSGWQVVNGERIYNPVTLREYRIAQEALNRKIIGGKTGGLKTQQKRREQG